MPPRSPEHDLLTTAILTRGAESTGSLAFSVRVRRRLPDFVQSVNLKYVKLGYHYLINHGVLLSTIPQFVVLFSAEIGSLSKEEIWKRLWEDARYDLATVFSIVPALFLTLSVYFLSRPRSIYLVDFACFKSSDDLKVAKEEFIEAARRSGKFDEEILKFQKRILESSGIGDETYIPKVIMSSENCSTMKEAEPKPRQS